jgi:hypothetical protein
VASLATSGSAPALRAWLVLAVVTVPLSWWWLSLVMTAPSPAGLAIAAVPLLLVCRAFVRGAAASLLTGVVIALCLVGIPGIGIVFAPIGLATLILALWDLGRRPSPRLWSVTIAAAAFVATFVAVIVGS